MHHFQYRQGELCAEEVPVARIVEQVGTPVYLYSLATLRRHYRVFDEAFARIKHLVCFSIRGGVNLNGKQVFVDDQFTSAPAGSFGQLTLGAAYQLCAPSFKQIIPPPPS